MSIVLTATQKRICEQVINAFETGTAEGDYAAISIFADGPGEIRQITYGRSQTTEWGNLESLVQAYVDAGGIHSAALRPFIDKIGITSLVDDKEFKRLLREAGRNDPIMRRTQDVFFDAKYFRPAMKWAGDNGFSLSLSALVIYDSFIHSGHVPWFLRKRFAESTPGNGGREKVWIRDYVDIRHEWLRTHERPILRNTIYRTRCFQRELARGNWDLSQVPIDANGVAVSGV